MMSVISYLSIGSNVGNLVANVHRACKLIQSTSTSILCTSYIYQSAPMYITQQPTFLNCAIKIATKLQPHELLSELKSIECRMGRVDNVRYGERVIDLDIIEYNNTVYSDDILTIPHPRLYERMFVLQPLNDIDPFLVLPDKQMNVQTALQQLNDNTQLDQQPLQRVLPLGNFNNGIGTYKLLPLGLRTYIMGILNITSDSFSDGGLYNDVDRALMHCENMINDGADIIDIGGESSRPGSTPLNSDIELARIIPVIDGIRHHYPHQPISVDTYHSHTAHIVAQHGVQIVNDISCGKLDDQMHHTVAYHQILYCGMHMRGTPQTMAQSIHTQYNDILDDVNHELSNRVHAAMNAGIYKWNIIADPGLGFSKTASQSLHLLANINEFHPVGNIPVLVGASRKRFIEYTLQQQRTNQSMHQPVDMQGMLICVCIFHLYLLHTNIISTYQ